MNAARLTTWMLTMPLQQRLAATAIDRGWFPVFDPEEWNDPAAEAATPHSQPEPAAALGCATNKKRRPL
jgi:hypothetical protein